MAMIGSRWTQEERDAFINAQNERYEREMKMFVDVDGNEFELDEHFCDEGGHYWPEYAPDGKDLWEAEQERIMQPSLDEQMSSPEFRLTTVEANHTYLNMGISNLREETRKLWRATEEIEVSLSQRIDVIEETVNELLDLVRLGFSRIFPNNDGVYVPIQPDDFDTQEQEKEFVPIFLEDESEEEIQERLAYKESLAPNFWEERKETLITNNGTQFEMKIPEGVDW